MNMNEAASIMGRKGGRSKSKAKQEASRLNGKKGGRPRKAKNYIEAIKELEKRIKKAMRE